MSDEIARLKETLAATHGGEPLALLSELDAAREELARLRASLAEAERERDAAGFQRDCLAAAATHGAADVIANLMTQGDAALRRAEAAEAKLSRVEAVLSGFLSVFWPTADEGHTGFVDRLGMEFYRETGIWPAFKSAPMEMDALRSDAERDEAQKAWRKWLDEKRDAAAAAAVAALTDNKELHHG